jgi:hypothetical protein
MQLSMPLNENGMKLTRVFLSLHSGVFTDHHFTDKARFRNEKVMEHVRG